MKKGLFFLVVLVVALVVAGSVMYIQAKSVTTSTAIAADKAVDKTPAKTCPNAKEGKTGCCDKAKDAGCTRTKNAGCDKTKDAGCDKTKDAGCDKAKDACCDKAKETSKSCPGTACKGSACEQTCPAHGDKK